MNTPLLSNPLRPALLAAARSQRLERGLVRVPTTRQLVNRFVAGESTAHGVAAVRDLRARGLLTSIDYLGEDVTQPGQASQVVEAYLTLIDALAELPNSPESGARPLEVSLKLSALGRALPDDGFATALANARTISRAAAAAGIWVTIDAEDHTTTDSTLDIVRALRREHPDVVGTVLQAYLRRTEDDCREFAASGARIRLCKGAYNEPDTVAFRRKRDVDAAYLRCLRILMAGTGYPMVATHDPAMIESAALQALAVGRGTADFEFQMLYGIREAEQARLVNAGQRVRVYVPFGDEWYGYFVRRLAERPANLMFFLRSARH